MFVQSYNLTGIILKSNLTHTHTHARTRYYSNIEGELHSTSGEEGRVVRGSLVDLN